MSNSKKVNEKCSKKDYQKSSKRVYSRSDKAITLIALVITVIILLILAGITINKLSNSGIFEKAKEAKGKYTNAQEYEETEIAKMTNNIDGYVDNTRESSGVEEIKKLISDGAKVYYEFKYNNTDSYDFVVPYSGIYKLECWRSTRRKI